MRRTPLARSREKPRRNEGRIAHERVKPKETKTQEMVRHHGRLVLLGCIACGANIVTIHHVTASIHGGRIARSHKRVVPLCPRHHLIQHGPRESVEALGHGGFFREHGINLLTEADRLWKESHV